MEEKKDKAISLSDFIANGYKVVEGNDPVRLKYNTGDVYYQVNYQDKQGNKDTVEVGGKEEDLDKYFRP